MSQMMQILMRPTLQGVKRKLAAHKYLYTEPMESLFPKSWIKRGAWWMLVLDVACLDPHLSIVLRMPGSVNI